MGTSRSSSGSPSNVPMVPPWVPEILPIEPTEEPKDENETTDDDERQGETEKPQNSNEMPIPIAPPGRFRSTRTALSKFAASGDKRLLRRGVGRYISSGMGGSSTAARRFGGTASNAGRLYSALGGTGTGSESNQAGLDKSLLAGKTAKQIADTIIELVCPIDGTQETESGRKSINDALTELLKRHPKADLLNLTEDQRALVVEYYVSMDVFRRFVLDVGKSIREKAPSITTALSRLKEAKDYIKVHVTDSFNTLRKGGTVLRGSHVARVVARALEDAFEIFAGYSQ